MSQKSLLCLSMGLWVVVSLAAAEMNEQKKEVGIPFFNLDFEYFSSNLYPKYWGYVGGLGYDIRIDTAVVQSGKASLFMECNLEKREDFGHITNTFPIEIARGKKIRYTGWIKTEDVKNGYAGIWMRVDDKEKIILLDNMGDRGVTGTTEWKEYAIEIDVPAEGNGMSFGCLFDGTGKAWFDQLQIYLDGKSILQSKPVLILPKSADLRWIKKNAVLVRSLDPLQDLSDLQPLKRIIGDTKLVGFGLATSGTHEIIQMEHRIIRFLMEQMEFSIYIRPIDMIAAHRIDQFIQGGEGDPESLLKGFKNFSSLVISIKEYEGVLQWMREFNKTSDKKIHIAGTEVGWSSLVNELFPAYEKADKEGYPRAAGLIQRNLDMFKKSIYELSESADKNGIERLKKDLADLYSYANENRKKLLAQFSREETDLWIDYFGLYLNQINLIPLKSGIELYQCRADRIAWTINRFPEGTKAIFTNINLTLFKSWRYGGKQLHQIFGDKYFMLGTAIHQGNIIAIGRNGVGTFPAADSEPGTLEWFFHQSGLKNFILDLQGAGGGDKKGKWLDQNFYFRILELAYDGYGFARLRPLANMDAVLFIETSTPTDSYQLKEGKEKMK